MLGAPRHATRRSRPARAVAFAVALVLGIDVVLVAGGFARADVDGAAGAAVGLATTVEPLPAPADPLPEGTAELAVPPVVDSAATLPQPEPAPADPYAPTPEIRLGHLEIPAIGLSQPMSEGVTLTAINRGPSHWPGTALPGQDGNVVVAGHRTTYTRPFWSLNELEPGDELIFTVDGDRHVYGLDRVEIVAPTDIHIVDQTPGRTATLFGCHPRGSARQRIVAHFTLRDTATLHFHDNLGPAGRPSGL